MQDQLHRQLPQADAEQADDLAQMLGMERNELDTQLPALRWCKQGGTYALRDVYGFPHLLCMPVGGPVTEIDAALVENANDQLPEAVAARKLHRLMTGFAPRYVQALLFDKAAPVWIGGETFHLPVNATGTHTAQVRFSDDSVLHLVRSSAAAPYIPAAGPPARQASSAPRQPAVQPVVLLSTETGEDNSAGFSLLDTMENDPLEPLFGLDSDAARLIKPEVDYDAAPVGATEQAPASGSPQTVEDDARPQPKRARLDGHASAEQQWKNFCAHRTTWLPVWAALDKNRQLLLQAAATSLPSKQEYAAHRQQAEQDGLPFIGERVVQTHRNQRFADLANDIVKATQRIHYSEQNQQTRIERLNEAAFQNVVQAMLDEANGRWKPMPDDNKPDTLKRDYDLKKIQGTLNVLEKVAQKAQEADAPSGETWLRTWLRTTLNEMLPHLPKDERAVPADTINTCVQKLAEALGISIESVKLARPAIKTLTGVDLSFQNVRSAHAGVPAPDHPIPASGRSATLRSRFDNLPSAPAKETAGDSNRRWSANQIVFLGFFEKRESIRNAADPKGKHVYADPISAAMWLLEQLEKRIGADDKPQKVEPWLKGVFGRALDKTVTEWSGLGTLTLDEKKSVRRTLQADLKIDSNNKKDHHLFPLILHLTGVSLWIK